MCTAHAPRPLDSCLQALLLPASHESHHPHRAEPSANHLNLQAYELSVLTGTQVLLLVVSETGLVYTFTTPKLQPLVTKPEGKNLIQVRCRMNRTPSHVMTNLH